MLKTELEFSKENTLKRHQSYSDKLLIPDHPLQVLPRLAVKIGLNEALILQQVHYWINNPLNQNVKDGRVWVYNTYDQWKEQFPFWCKNTIISTIYSLENQKLLISREFNKLKRNRTKWYTIDYEVINNLEIGSAKIENTHLPKSGSPIYQNLVDPSTKIQYIHLPDSGRCTITETTSETTTENNPSFSKKPIKKCFDAEFDEFWAINPKPVDKLESKEVFNRLLTEDYSNFQKIMDGRRAQNVVIELEATERKYIKGPAAWLRKKKFNDEVQTQEQLHAEHQRSISKITNQPRKLSKVDQQHSLNAELRESAAREVQNLNEERAAVAREIARRERAESITGREYSHQSL